MNVHDIGAQLRELRHARQETLEEVSTATGLSVAMLSRIERGERLPSPESVEALAAHFGLALDELMGRTIASRMLNRYGREGASRAAERLNAEPAEPPTADTLAAPEPSSPAPSFPAATLRETWAEPLQTRTAAVPMRRAGMAFSVLPIEELFGDAGEPVAAEVRASTPAPESAPESAPQPGPDSALDALADAARVAQVALESALAAAGRAKTSGDPRLIAEAERLLESLRRTLDGGR